MINYWCVTQEIVMDDDQHYPWIKTATQYARLSFCNILIDDLRESGAIKV